MNTINLAVAALFVSAFVLGCSAEAPVDGDIDMAEQAQGNGAPHGPHYNLNIIGVQMGKTADMTGNNGGRIFVPLYGNAKINLREGDFQVLDANGTDADGAAFQLPDPDTDGDGFLEYQVYARALGTPGGGSNTTTCFTDTTTGEEVCSVNTLRLKRTAGSSKFVNVSKDLLQACADFDGDGTIECAPLFADGTVDWYWQYDNAGLKLAQLRFYQQN